MRGFGVWPPRRPVVSSDVRMGPVIDSGAMTGRGLSAVCASPRRLGLRYWEHLGLASGA
jgi:hypothetical protein